MGTRRGGQGVVPVVLPAGPPDARLRRQVRPARRGAPLRVLDRGDPAGDRAALSPLGPAALAPVRSGVDPLRGAGRPDRGERRGWLPLSFVPIRRSSTSVRA